MVVVAPMRESASGGDNVVQPSFARATIGIREDKDFNVGRELFDANAEIVNLFTGACGFSSNDNMGFHVGGGSDGLTRL